MSDKYILGVDIGSTNIKAIVFSQNGSVKGSHSCEIIELYPAEGYVEQAPVDIWNKFCRSIKEAVMDSGVDPADIIGVGLDSNRCGLLLLDEDFQPLSNLITWRDTRSGEQVSSFVSANTDIDCYSITGEDGLPQHTLFKALWYQQHEPEIWKACRYILFSPKDYVILKMLGRNVTSKSIAQSSGLFDINTLQYSRTILGRAHIPIEMLPELYDSNLIIGNIDGEMVARTGLAKGTPIICGICDATASQIGSGSVYDGMLAVSIGTCGAVRGFTEKPHFQPDHSTQIRVVSPFGYVPSCTVSDSGSVMKWFRNHFCLAEQEQAQKTGADVYEIISAKAESIQAGSEGLLLLPYFTGSSYARKDEIGFGMFAGIRHYHTKAHFIRAIMEGVAFSLKSVVDHCFLSNNFLVQEVRLVGGGAKSDLWSQILCDIFDVPVYVPACEESACLGSAIMVALSTGVYQSLAEAVGEMVTIGKKYYPNPQNREAYRHSYILFDELNKDLSDSGYYQRYNTEMYK